MFSSKKHSITLIVIGRRPSPFLKSVDDMHYAVDYVFNNSCDFVFEHPDPAKRLSYHHELFGLLEKKVQEYKPLNDILKLLSSTFDSFNPLNMPPVINMLGRYASHVESRADQRSFYTQLASFFHLNQGSIHPLFKSSPPILVGVGKAASPLRQFLFEVEHKVGQYATKGAVDGAGALGEPNNQAPAGKIDVKPASLVDAQLSDSFRNPLASSSGVVIVPTDRVSTYFVFSCPAFRQLLGSFGKKVTLLSPAWAGNEVTPAEREVLDFLAVPWRFDAFLTLVLGNLVDTIIVQKGLDAVDGGYTRLAKEYTVVEEDLSPENQHSDGFFHSVLRTLSIDRESLRIDTLKEKVDLSEKIASALKQYNRLF